MRQRTRHVVFFFKPCYSIKVKLLLFAPPAMSAERSFYTHYARVRFRVAPEDTQELAIRTCCKKFVWHSECSPMHRAPQLLAHHYTARWLMQAGRTRWRGAGGGLGARKPICESGGRKQGRHEEHARRVAQVEASGLEARVRAGAMAKKGFWNVPPRKLGGSLEFAS